jgi:antitoxin component of MazEF toxin-antitoxin module
METHALKFRRKLIKMGDSFAVTLPREITEYLNIKHGGEIFLSPDSNEKGKLFVAIWSDEQENTTEKEE